MHYNIKSKCLDINNPIMFALSLFSCTYSPLPCAHKPSEKLDKLKLHL